MNVKAMVFIFWGLLFLGCSHQPTSPQKENDLAFTVVACEQADEFFQNQDNFLANPSGYYACFCPSKTNTAEMVIPFTLPEPMRVKVVIMSGTGYTLKTYDQVFPVGLSELYWDETGPGGKPVEPGLYIVSILAEIGYRAKMFTILQKE
ncbi:MAG: hypothetical protein WCE90_01685 [Candidatus Zixiibacteriota bacterium]